MHVFDSHIEHEDQVVESLEQALGDRTKLLVIDHVTSPTGLVFPIKKIVELAHGYGIRVLVDGAHAPGMLDLDVGALNPAWYTGNLHKWVCAPKGAAFLWVAEPFRDSMVAASVSHGYNDGWPGSESRFHAQFDWTGTDDPTARLCVAAALDAMATHRDGGWAAVRDSNRELVLAGRDVVIDALGIDAPAPDPMIGSIAAMPVPPDPDPSPSIFDPLMTALRDRWSIEVPVFSWPASPQRLLRISAQQYNTVDDYHALAEALAAEIAGL